MVVVGRPLDSVGGGLFTHKHAILILRKRELLLLIQISVLVSQE